MSSKYALCFALITAVGCSGGGDEPDGGPGDTGRPADTGVDAGRVDTGPDRDTGPNPDGSTDAGPDAGQDAGQVERHIIGLIGDRTIDVGRTLRLDLEKMSMNGPTSFVALPLPLVENMRLDGETGAFTFRPRASQVGSYPITLAATDDDGTDRETITLTVNMPNLAAPELTGQILDANDASNGTITPLAGVTIRSLDNGQSTTSDAQGNFTLTGLTVGTNTIEYDGSSSPAGDYAGYRARINIEANLVYELPQPLYLMQIDPAGTGTIDPAQPLTLTNPNLGVTLRIPAGAVKADDGSNYAGPISISEVPVGFTPSALPEDMRPSLVVTVQPMGLSFDQAVPFTFPNTDNLPPATVIALMSLNHATGQFFEAGKGVVSSDGSVIEAAAGGLREASWHLFIPVAPWVMKQRGSRSTPRRGCPRGCVGSDAALNSGDLSVTHAMPAYVGNMDNQAGSMVYHSLSACPQATLPSSFSHHQIRSVPDMVRTRSQIGGVDVGRPAYIDTSPGPGFEPFVATTSFDARAFPTNVYPFRTNGTSVFGRAERSSSTGGFVAVNNKMNSPFGVGWNYDGVDRLHIQPNGSVVLDKGNGEVGLFRKRYELVPAVMAMPLDLLQWQTRAGDLDQDGHLDLLVVGRGLHVHLGDGTGNFEPIGVLSPDAPGLSATDAELVDLDFDGDLDVIYSHGRNIGVGNCPSPGIWTAVNDGAGLFSAPVNYLPTGDTCAAGFATADVDADGRLDVVTWFEGNNISVMRGDGDGGFLAAEAVSNAISIADLELGDVDSDGIIDILFSSRSNTRGIRWLKGNGDATFELEQELHTIRVGIFKAVDFDMDGTLDTVGLSDNDGGGRALRVAFGDGAGGIKDQFEITYPDLQQGLLVEDMDGDDNLDIIVSNRGPAPGYVQFFRGLGFGAVEPPAVLQFPGGNNQEPWAYSTGDFNEDGLLDAVVTNFLKTEVTLLFGRVTTELYGQNGFRGRLISEGNGTFTHSLPDQTISTFDSSGLLTERQSPMGATTAFDYDALDRLMLVTNPDGSTESLQYNGDYIDTITTPAGVTSFEHDADGHLIRLMDPDGFDRQFTYDSKGKMMTQTDKSSVMTSYSYQRGRFASSTRLGVTRSLIAADSVAEAVPQAGMGDAMNPLPIIRSDETKAVFTNGNGEATEALVDEFGNPRVVQDQAGNTVEILRNEHGEPTRVTNTEGVITTLERDDDGRVTLVTEAVGTPSERTMSMTYDKRGNPLTMTDGRNQAYTMTYDGAGMLQNVAGPEGMSIDYTFAPGGLPTSITDAAGRSLTQSYDTSGNLETLTTAAGTTRWTRDAAGRVLSYTQGDGTAEARTVGLPRDAQGRIQQVDLPTGGSIVYSFDNQGRRTGLTMPTGEALSATYNDMGLLTGVTGSIDGPVSYTWDNNNNMLSYTADAKTTSYEYNADGLLTRIEHPDGTERTMTYDAAGRTETTTDEIMSTHTFVRDELGRVVQRIMPSGGMYSFTYDEMGNVLTRRDPGNIVVTYTYDDLGRLTQARRGGHFVNYTYDAAGNPLTVNSQDVNTTNTFDNDGRLLTSNSDVIGTGLANNLTYIYDATGLATDINLSSVGTFSYGYDASGRVTSVTPPGGTAINLAHDQIGRVTSVTHASGVATTQTYDATGRTNAINHTFGATPLSSQTLTYDTGGRIATIDDAAGSRSYTYDMQGRVATGAGAYSYNASGDLTSSPTVASITYDNNHFLVTDDVYDYTYDPRGRLQTRRDRNANRTETYLWDNIDRLIRISWPGTTIDYAYDGGGRRVEKAVNGVVTRYAWEGERLVAEFDGSNNRTTTYVYDPGTDRLLALVVGAQTYAVLSDVHGSPRALIDGTGTEVGSVDYDIYGNAMNRVGMRIPIGWSGAYVDNETGYQYTGTRYYDARTARYLAADLLDMLRGGSSCFAAQAFKDGDPANNIDLLNAAGVGLNTLTDMLESRNLRNFTDRVRHARRFGSSGRASALSAFNRGNERIGRLKVTGGVLGVVGILTTFNNERSSIPKCDPSRNWQSAGVAFTSIVTLHPTVGLIKLGSDGLDYATEKLLGQKAGAFEVLNNAGRVPAILFSGDVNSGNRLLAKSRSGKLGAAVEVLTKGGDKIAENDTFVNLLSKLF